MQNVKHSKRHYYINGQFWQNGSNSESGFSHTTSMNKILKSLLSKVNYRQMDYVLSSLSASGLSVFLKKIFDAEEAVTW